MAEILTVFLIIIFLLRGCESIPTPTGLVFPTEVPTGPLPTQSVRDCTYDIESGERIKVSLRTDNQTMQSLYGTQPADMGGRDFVLIKREVGIPCTKMWNWAGVGEDSLGGEVIRIGTVLSVPGFQSPEDLGDEVYLARGHCFFCETGTCPSGAPRQANRPCVDQLSLQTVFTLRDGGEGRGKAACQDAGGDLDQTDGYWWYFDVYLDKDYFVDANGNGSVDDSDGVPSWIGNCENIDYSNPEARWPSLTPTSPPAAEVKTETRLAKANLPSLSISGKVLGINSVIYPSIISGSQITCSGNCSQLKEFYRSDRLSSSLPAGLDEIGTYEGSTLPVFLSGDGLILGIDDGEGGYILYLAIDSLNFTPGRSLQLGSFSWLRPTGFQRRFMYEWYTPSCKPALYFYPEKPTELSVIVKPQGKITQSIPDHKDGWQIVAYPDGTIRELNGTKYPYLYYEAEIEKIKVPQEKFLVESKDLPEFFGQALPLLGLNQKEATDFLKYWLPKLQGGKKWLIGLLPKEEIDRVEKIEFSSNPDSFLRVRFYFRPYKAVNETIVSGKIIYSKGMNLEYFLNNLGIWSFRQKPQRSGFTVVDWGGILAGGDCGISEIAQ